MKMSYQCLVDVDILNQYSSVEPFIFTAMDMLFMSMEHNNDNDLITVIVRSQYREARVRQLAAIPYPISIIEHRVLAKILAKSAYTNLYPEELLVRFEDVNDFKKLKLTDPQLAKAFSNDGVTEANTSVKP